MPQLFSHSADSWIRSLILIALIGPIGVVGVILAVSRSSYVTGQSIAVDQPILFSHEHHVGDIGIDCRYCHASVETSAVAGMPATGVCMNCHRELWNQAEMLEPLRIYYRREEPIQWNRVHDLPDYVYFNHSIHLHKGIGCYSCHGEIGEMPLTRQAAPLTMQWCLDCHRSPQQHVRPREYLFEPKPLEKLVGADRTSVFADVQLATDPQAIRRNTDCYTCHR